MLLLILHPTPSKNAGSKESISEEMEMEKEGRDALGRHIASIIREGIKVTAEVRIGDPYSEFLKFLAQNSSFQAVVWGSADPFSRGKPSKIEDHWLGKVQAMIECPLVVPSQKSKRPM